MSLRIRILLIVLVASVVPLALVGFWLTGNTVRSGERLLEQRLEQGVSETVAVVTARWTRLRSSFLSLAESPEVREALASSTGAGLLETVAALVTLDPGVLAISVRDTQDVERWRTERPEMLSAVTEINQQIAKLAPVLNTPTLKSASSILLENKKVPIAFMIKEYEKERHSAAAACI